MHLFTLFHLFHQLARARLYLCCSSCLVCASFGKSISPYSSSASSNKHACLAKIRLCWLFAENLAILYCYWSDAFRETASSLSYIALFNEASAYSCNCRKVSQRHTTTKKWTYFQLNTLPLSLINEFLTIIFWTWEKIPSRYIFQLSIIKLMKLKFVSEENPGKSYFCCKIIIIIKQ